MLLVCTSRDFRTNEGTDLAPGTPERCTDSRLDFRIIFFLFHTPNDVRISARDRLGRSTAPALSIEVKAISYAGRSGLIIADL